MRRFVLSASVLFLAACGGGGSDPTPPVNNPSITISAGTATVTATQGTSVTVPISVTRSGGAAGDVSLAAEGLPANVTASFAPSPIPAASTSSTMTLVVGAGATAATSTVTVRATIAGAAAQTATVQLTVTSAGSFSLAATSASTVQGATGNSTVTITRAGGFAGAVALTTGTLPANVTASFNPVSATGATSTLTFTAGGTAVPGTYTVAVNGTGTGVANQTTNVTLTVTASGGGGSIAWQFCDAARVPVWFAFRDGSSGAWTRVQAGANNTFNFTINQSVGSVAFATVSGGSSDVDVNLLTRAELQVGATQECLDNPAAGKTLSGAVAGLAANDVATINHGGATASASFAATNYVLQNVYSGPQDLLAYRVAGSTVSRMFLQRGLNVANGGTLPVVDFNGASSFAPAVATITVANSGSDSFFILPEFETANGASFGLFFDFAASGPTRTYFGVPTDRLIAGDIHSASVFSSAANNIEARGVVSYFRTVSNRTVTLGALPNVPTVSSSTAGGFARPRARATIQSEYGDVFSASFSQINANKTITVTASRGFFGSATDYDLETPDFSGVAGFNSAWAIAAGAATEASIRSFGGINILNRQPVDGGSWRFAQRTTTFTP
jgi:hypothetical protein